MADIQSNIRIDVDTSGALAAIRNLQSQISQFQTSMNRGTAAQAAAASKLSQQLVSGINATGKFAASIKTVQTSSEAFTGALERNQLSMGQYFRYSAASTKTFGKMFRAEFNTIEKTARERVKTLQTQYVKLGRDANGAMKSIAIRPLALDMNDLGTQTAMAAQKQQIMNQLLKQGSTNLLNFGKNTQWAGRQLMVGFTIPLTIFGGIAAKTFMDLEEQVINFKKVYGDLFTTDQQADKALSDVRALADEFTKYGVAVSETVGLAAEAAAAGFDGTDLINQTSAAIKISVLGQLDQQKALETTIALQNAFKLSSEDLAESIDFLNAVENQTVVALDDITTAIPKVAPVIQALGGDVRDLAFFLSAMKEGGVNASEGANALKSSLGRLINPTKVAREMFNGFGIDLVDIVERNAGNLRQTVLDLGTALDTLDPLNRSRAIEQLFGKFQFARMSTLFENINRDGTQAARVLDLAAYSAADLAKIADEELGVSAASAMNKFRGALERLQAALAPVGELFLNLVTPVLDFTTKVIDSFNKLSEGAKSFVAGLAITLGVIGPVALMTFGLIANGAANLIKGFLFVRNAFQKTGKQSQILGEQTEYLTQQQLEEMAVAASLETSQNRLTQTFTSQTAAINKLIAAYEKAMQRQKQFTGVSGAGISTTIGAATRGGTRAYKSGTVSVPGSGFGDKVPAMLEPGEAVIPRKQAQKYSDVIKSMVSGNIPGFRFGFNPFSFMMKRSRVATRMSSTNFVGALRSGNKSYQSGFATGTGADFTDRLGRPMKQHQLMRRQAENKLYGTPVGSNNPALRPTYGSVATSPLQRIINLLFGRKGRQFNRVTNPMASNLDQYGDISLIGKRGMNKRASTFVGDTLLKYSKNPAWVKGTAPMVGSTAAQRQAAGFDAISQPFGATKTRSGGASVNAQPSYIEAQTMGGFEFSEIKKIITKDPATRKLLQQELRASGMGNIRVSSPNFLTKLMQKLRVPGFKNGLVPGFGKGDKFPALLEPGEAVIPADASKKYAPFINGMIAGNLPGFKTGKVVENTGSGGTAVSPGGNTLNIGNKHTLRAVGELLESLDEAEDVVDLAFESLADKTDISISEFRQAIADSAKKLGEPVPSAVKGAKSGKHSASDVGETRTHRQQIEDERGAEGLAEYEREEAAAKELRLELERINQEKIEAGQTPLFSESDIKDMTQIDRSHIVEVDKAAMGRSSFHSDLTKPELGARNRFSGTMQKSPQNQQMMKETMQEMGISQKEQNALMDKYTSGLALTEEEHDLQARVLRRVLKKLEENSKLRKKVSPAFEKSATGVVATAKVKDADPNLKASKERDTSAAEAKRDQLIADKEAKTADKKAKAAKKQEKTANKDKKTSDTKAKTAKEQQANAKKDAQASAQHSKAARDAALASKVFVEAANQQKIAAMQTFSMSNRRVTTNPATAAASVQQQLARRDASGMGFLSVGQRAAQSNQGQGQAFLNSLNGLTGGIMQASFAFSSISMLAGGMGGELGALSEVVFMISNAMFMLSAILPLVTAGFKRLAASMAANEAMSIGQLLKGIPGRVTNRFGNAFKSAKIATGPAALTMNRAGTGYAKTLGNLTKISKQLGGVLGKIVPMFLRFIPFLGAAITAFGAIKFIGDIQEKQKQKIEGMGNAAFAAGEKLKSIADVIGFTPTRDVDRSDQITGIEGLQAGGAQRAETIRDSEKFKELIEGEFKQDLENIKNASIDDAERILNALAIQQMALAPEGTDPARIQEFVAAIAAEAGKTDVDLSMVLSFDPFDEETFKQIEQDIKKLADIAEEEFGDVEIGRETTQSRQKQFSPTVPAETQAQAKLIGSEFSSLAEQLSSGLAAGTLGASEFIAQMGMITESITALDPVIAGITFEKMFENIGLPEVIDGIENIETQALLLQASIAGVDITEAQLEMIAAGEESEATALEQANAQTVLNTIMYQYGTEARNAAQAVKDVSNAEQDRFVESGITELDDKIKANKEMLDLYPELVAALGSEEEALNAVNDEKIRNLIIEAKAKDLREGGTANYDAIKNGLNEVAESQEDVNNMTAKADLQTYIKDLQEQNSVLSWLTSNGVPVAEALDIIGDSMLYTAATTAKAEGNLDGFMLDLEKIKDLELPTVGGTAQKSPFQEAIDGLKEERKQLKETTTSYNKLRRAGFGITEAFSAAKDPVLATAIATTQVGTSKWETLVNLLKQVDTLASKNAIKDLVGQRAAENDITEAFVEVAQILGEMGYKLEDIREIMNDPQLMAAFIEDLEDGSLDAKLLLDYLTQIENKKAIEIEIQLSTPEGIESEFDRLYGEAMEGFSVRRDRVEDDFEDSIKSAEDAIEATNDAIEAAERQIESIQTTISDKQREIEINIARPIEEFQDQIADLERQIELDFTRPITELQEESSDLANDLSLMDKEAEEINERYNDQLEALEDISQINERIARQQKGQLDVADALSQGDIAAAAKAAQQMREQEAAARDQAARDAIEASRQRELEGLRTKAGLTREQIENRQFEISQKIYNLEESREEVQLKIQGIQDKIYELEQLREKKLLEIRNLEDQIYGIEVGQLRALRDKLRDQEDMLDKINDEKDLRLEAIALEEEKWNDTKLAFDEAMERGKDYIAMLKEALRLLGLLDVPPPPSSGGGSRSSGDSDNGSSSGSSSSSSSGSSGGSPGTGYVPVDQKIREELGAEPDETVIDGKVVGPSGSPAGETPPAKGTAATGDSSSVYGPPNPPVPNISTRAGYEAYKQTILSNRDAVRSGNLSSSERTRLMKENIFLMQSTGLKLAVGGQVPGYGSIDMLRKKDEFSEVFKPKGTDTVPAMLTPGEFVIRKSSAEKLGSDFLNQINQNGKVPTQYKMYGGSVDLSSIYKKEGIDWRSKSSKPEPKSADERILENRARVRSGNISASEKQRLINENIKLIKANQKKEAAQKDTTPNIRSAMIADKKKSQEQVKEASKPGFFQSFEAGFQNVMSKVAENPVVKAIGNAYSADNVGGQIFRGLTAVLSTPVEIMGAVAKNTVDAMGAAKSGDISGVISKAGPGALVKSIVEGTSNAFSGVSNAENQKDSMFNKAAQSAIDNDLFGAKNNKEMASLARIIGGTLNLAGDPLAYAGVGLATKAIQGSKIASKFATGTKQTTGNIVSDFKDVFKKNPASSVHNNKHVIDFTSGNQSIKKVDTSSPFTVSVKRPATDIKTDARFIEEIPLASTNMSKNFGASPFINVFLKEMKDLSERNGVPLRNVLENSRFTDMPEVSNAQQRSQIRNILSDDKVRKQISLGYGQEALVKADEAVKPSLLYNLNLQKENLLNAILNNDTVAKNFPAVTGKILNNRADRVKSQKDLEMFLRKKEIKPADSQSQKYEKFIESIQSDPNNTRLVIAAQSEAARKILKTRSYKPQGKEQGRTGRENQFLGTGSVSDYAQPAYGALYNKDMVPFHKGFSTLASDGYGEIKMILPGSIAKRTRVVAGDSILEESEYTQSLQKILQGNKEEAAGLFSDALGYRRYAEAQILGGLPRLPKNTTFTMNKPNVAIADSDMIDITRAEYTREGLLGGGNAKKFIENLVAFTGSDQNLLKKFRFADKLDISDSQQMQEFKNIVNEVKALEAAGKGRIKTAEYEMFKNMVEGYNPGMQGLLQRISPIRRAVGGAIPSQASGAGNVGYFPMGGKVPYKAAGGLFQSINTDTVPAMLTPGEFVVRKYAVDKYGTDTLKSINNGTYNGESVYNYNLSVNVKSDANPDDIARVVMTKIKQVDSQRMRSNRF